METSSPSVGHADPLYSGAPGDEFTDADYVQGMERLMRAVQELPLARSLPDVQRIVRTSARELTGCDGATFVLRDNGKCFYADEDAIAPLWKGSRFPMDICISGWAMLNRRRQPERSGPARPAPRANARRSNPRAHRHPPRRQAHRARG